MKLADLLEELDAVLNSGDLQPKGDYEVVVEVEELSGHMSTMEVKGIRWDHSPVQRAVIELAGEAD